MNTLIAYASNAGTTEKCVLKLKDLIKGEITLINLEKEKIQNLDIFDNIILGGSIRVGKVQKSVKKFAKKNLVELLNKKVGIFLCMGETESKFESYLTANFSNELLSSVSIRGFFGGEFIYEKMPKFMAKMLKKSAEEKGEPRILEENIAEFAGKLGS